MKNIYIVSITTLVIGVFFGYLLWGNRPADTLSMGGMHQMSDGSMMGGNSTMDMDQMMDSMMAGLEGKTGDAFDKEFLSEMIVHHQGAVVMAQAVLKNSKRPELIKLANEIISAQNTEINMMKSWQNSWFNINN